METTSSSSSSQEFATSHAPLDKKLSADERKSRRQERREQRSPVDHNEGDALTTPSLDLMEPSERELLLTRRDSEEDILRESQVHEMCTNFAKMMEASASTDLTASLRDDFLFGGFDHDSGHFSQGSNGSNTSEHFTTLENVREVVEEEDAAIDTPPDVIEVAPGETLPFIRADTTFQALMEGQVLVSKCTCCETDLTCVDYATVIVCADCWAFSPVDQEEQTNCFQDGCVCLGIKEQDIVEWLNQQEQLES